MDNELQYAEAITPRCHYVAGVRLVPFCVGHAVLLTRLQNPFRTLWGGDEEALRKTEIGSGDLAQALWVCSRPATRALSTIDRFWTPWGIRRIHARVLGAGVIPSLGEMYRYLGHGFTGPKLARTPEAKTNSGAPLLAMLMSSLTAHFGKTSEEALDTPLATALWDRAAYLEQQGLIRFWTKEDEELLDWAKQLSADPDLLESIFAESERRQQEQEEHGRN